MKIIKPKWAHRYSATCYDRHPVTGSNKYHSLYFHSYSLTEQTSIKLCESHGWKYLYTEYYNTIVCVKEIK